MTLSLVFPSDRPDPPGLLKISDPKHRAVSLSWTPGDDHKSAVLGLVPAQKHSLFSVFLLDMYCF